MKVHTLAARRGSHLPASWQCVLVPGLLLCTAIPATAASADNPRVEAAINKALAFWKVAMMRG